MFNEDVKHLEGRKNLTYLTDGWEDVQHWSVYGLMLAEVSRFPVVLGLEELNGRHAIADNIMELSNCTLVKKSIDPKSIIAVCTDNPTTMQAF